MTRFNSFLKEAPGFSLVEIIIVLAGACIIMAIGVPLVNTAVDQYQVRLCAQNIVSQLQFARMKAVSSNEPFQVNFPVNQNCYQVESSNGTVIAGPFFLPRGISWNNTDPGSGVSFPGRIVAFLPSGNIPASGIGSGGRARIINQSGTRIDIIVGSGGMIRQTPPYRELPAPY